MALLFLESVGTTELLLILVVALIIFGPRKLPELSRSLGRGLSEFRRASDDFKRTWEREVNLERYERESADAMLPPEEARAESTSPTNTIAGGAGAEAGANSIAREASAPTASPAQSGASAVEPAPQSPHKTDWL